MTPSELAQRTKKFSIASLRLADQLPKSIAGRTIGGQLARSASSVAANYREAQRARSKKEFVSKLAISIQEAEETRFWLESIGELFPQIYDPTESLRDECTQLIAILTASRKTASGRARNV